MLTAKQRTSAALWLFSAISLFLLGGLWYAVKTSWQNQERLTQVTEEQNDRLTQIDVSIQGLRRAVVRMLLKGNGADASIAADLVSDTALQGIGQFNSGSFLAAYATWSGAAAKGDKDATFAIATATAELEGKLRDPSLSSEDRAAIEAALKSVPQQDQTNGDLIYRPGN